MAFMPDIQLKRGRLHYQDVTPYPRVGQYWVHTNPLALHRVSHVDFDEYGTVILEAWTPECHVKDKMFMLPMSPEWVYLHHRYTPLPHNRDTTLGNASVGDVFCDGCGGLMFVGEVDGEITLLSDKDISDTKNLKLFQSGPARKGLTIWDHIDSPAGVKDGNDND